MKSAWIASFLFLFCLKAYSAPFEGREVGISGASPEAIATAKKIYKKGGNVVDAAVALSLSMGVTNPYFAALGGGGFALVKMNGKVKALDFREVAPAAMNKDSFSELDKTSSLTGGLAVAVPGTPAGLYELHKTYGKLKWSDLFEDAIKLAEEGFQIHGDFYKRLKKNQDRLNQTGKALLLRKGKAIEPGRILKQPQLAKALKFIRHKGIKEFYQGRIARDLVSSVEKAGGKMSLDDLKSYKVKWREPITAKYESHDIHMMPLPSSGGVVIKTALHLMDQWKIKNYESFGVQELHLFGEIMARSYRSRALLADPDYFENPTEKLLGPKYLGRLTRSISAFNHKKLDPLKEENYLPKESTETTHLSLLDKDGNSVALTITLNGTFGSGIFTDTYGINLNNEMDDFTTKLNRPNQGGLVQGSMNQVEAGKRPLSSMTPTIVEKDGKTRMVLGSPGGPRIISSVLQVIYRHIVSGFNIDEAIQAPRFHHQFIPNKYYYEKNKTFPKTIRELKKKGHNMTASWAGRVYGVTLNEGVIEAAFDSRLPGAADGY